MPWAHSESYDVPQVADPCTAQGTHLAAIDSSHAFETSEAHALLLGSGRRAVNTWARSCGDDLACHSGHVILFAIHEDSHTAGAQGLSPRSSTASPRIQLLSSPVPRVGSCSSPGGISHPGGTQPPGPCMPMAMYQRPHAMFYHSHTNPESPECDLLRSASQVEGPACKALYSRAGAQNQLQHRQLPWCDPISHPHEAKLLTWWDLPARWGDSASRAQVRARPAQRSRRSLSKKMLSRMAATRARRASALGILASCNAQPRSLWCEGHVGGHDLRWESCGSWKRMAQLQCRPHRQSVKQLWRHLSEGGALRQPYS